MIRFTKTYLMLSRTRDEYQEINIQYLLSLSVDREWNKTRGTVDRVLLLIPGIENVIFNIYL